MKVSTGGLLAALLVLGVAGTCVRLGFWQLDRLQQRRARNAVLARALALPGLALEGDSLAAVAREPSRYLHRRVRLGGVYDSSGEIILRGHALQGRPGVHLVTPLRVGGGDTAVLVSRGWAPAPDASSIDPRPLAEPGHREMEGILLPVPPTSGRAMPVVAEVNGARVVTYQRLALDSLRARVHYLLLPVLIQQLPESASADSLPVRLPLPAMDEGPHLGYAVQWFSFAAIALVGFLVVALRRARPSA